MSDDNGWRRWGDGMPELNQLIIFKEKWFNSGYVIGFYTGEKPDNQISHWKPFTDFVIEA